MRIRTLIWIIILLISNNTLAATKSHAPLFDNLGSFHHKISTDVSLAQEYFDQGFTLFYGFEWGESIRSFKEAIRLDPNCRMCYWGLALALGYKGNAPMTGHEYADAKTAIQKALTLHSKITPVEQTYIQALALRFQHVPKKVVVTGPFSCHANGAENASPTEMKAYAAAMKKIIADNPDDNDAKSLYAYALFDMIEWNFWDKDGKINPKTPEIVSTLQAALDNNKNHIGANHYYIHAVEQSPHPEAALVNAELLKKLVPGSEHLVHMPAHIFFLTGNYHSATDSNMQAINVYQHYSSICRTQGFEPEITYLYHHNFDYLRTTAAMEGRRNLALSAAQDLIDNLPDEWLEKTPDLQWFLPVPLYVETRFGLWGKILHRDMPDENYQYAIGMFHYARSMALAHTGDIKSAEDEQGLLQEIIKRGPSPDTLGAKGLNLLKIANEVLIATIANSHGDKDATFSHLKIAAQIQHDMGYHEPPDWYFPIKEALGNAYLKWGQFDNAIDAYEDVLKQYPYDPWVLFGLEKALRQSGDIKEADRIKEEFKQSWHYADIPEPIMMF